MVRVRRYTQRITLLAAMISCAEVVPQSRTELPVNACPQFACDGYGATVVSPECTDARCEVRAATDFVLLVSVPASSYLNGGRTFQISSADVDAAMDVDGCVKATCIALPSLARIRGEIIVPASLRARFGLDAADETIPARVEFSPIAKAGMESFSSGTLVANVKRLNGRAQYEVVLPAGRYERRIYPIAPYDKVPPIFTTLEIIGTGDSAVAPIQIGSTAFPLDSPDTTQRTGLIKRAAGLTGFRVWLEDATTKRRISSLVRIASGVSANVLLDTIGQNNAEGVLRDDVSIVVAPPDDSSVPRLESALANGVGFDQEIPDTPGAATMRGKVLGPGTSTEPLARSAITFTSLAIERENPNVAVTLLTYKTTIVASETGDYQVSLPRGRYLVDMDPGPTSLYASQRLTIEVLGDASIDLHAGAGLEIEGRLRTGDGRFFPDVDVVFLPLPPTSPLERDDSGIVHPKRFRTDAIGRFIGRVPPARYDITFAVPSWTGFPRVVLPNREIAEAGASPINGVVGVPGKIAYTIHAPDGKNAIPYAVVRAFTVPRGEARYVEVGTTLTDNDGNFEILLQP